MKLVSVIIPTYKGSKQLERAVNSVLKQTYKCIEIIVVDDNGAGTSAQKETEVIINKVKQAFPVKYIIHKENRNGACARNTGIGIASGNYICFLDDDDYFLPERIEMCVRILDELNYFDGVYTSVGVIKKGTVECLTYAEKKGNLMNELLLNESFLGTGSNIFITKKAVEKLEGFDEAFLRNQDLEFMLRFFRYFRMVGIPEILVIKGVNGVFNIPSYDKMAECKRMIRTKFGEEIKGLGSNIETFNRNEAFSLYSTSLFSKNRHIKIRCKRKLEEYRKLGLKELILFVIAMFNVYDKYVLFRSK